MSARPFEIILRQAIHSGDWSEIQNWIDWESPFDYGREAIAEVSGFPEEAFRSISLRLQDQTFLDHPESHRLFRLLEAGSSTLSRDQRATLLPQLEASFGKYHDVLSSYLICDLLGYQFADLNAVAVLQRLDAATSDPNLRSLVTMGIAMVAEYPREPEAGEVALGALNRLASDPADPVRREATAALNRLSQTKQRDDDLAL